MPNFKYKAKDLRGRTKSGVIAADSEAGAKSALAKLRLRPIFLRATNAPAGGGSLLAKFTARDAKGNLIIKFGEKRPSTKDLIVFTKQFATMIGSGVPLIQALGVLAEQQ